MNKNRMWKKTAAAGLAVILAGTACLNGITTVQAEDKTEKSKNDKKKETEAQSEKIVKGTKDETVYVKADASGETQSIIVSDWLKNSDLDVAMSDISELTGIKNVKGDETFDQSGSQLTWNADGNDIYYQGETDKELPVGIKVTYYLDDKEMSPEDMAGKSGKVRIRYDYINKAKSGEAYVPFTMVTGMILPTENFKNVTVTNGKVISDGSKNIAVGMGFPGLAESLKLKDTEETKDLDIPDYFEVTADAEEFTLAMTATVATADILNEFGFDDADTVDDLMDSVKELSDASTSLVDGSGELADGVKELQKACKTLNTGADTLNEKMGELSDGLAQLNSKKGELTSGAQALAGGIAELNEKKGTLIDGAGSLAAGASELKSGTASLQQGVTQYTAGVGTVKQGVDSYVGGASALAQGTTEYVNGVSQLADGLNNAGEGIESAKAAVAALLGQSISSDTAVLQTLMEVQGVVSSYTSNHEILVKLANNAVPVDEYTQKLADSIGQLQTSIYCQQQLLAQFGEDGDINKLLAGIGSLQAGAQELTANNQLLLDGAAELLNKGPQLTKGLGDLNASSASLNQGSAAAAQGASALAGGALSLSGGAAQLGDGVSALADGSSALAAGASELSSGVEALADGASQLKDGTDTLSSGTDDLVDGVKTLKKGADTLKDGMEEFDEDGIQKLSDALEGDMQEVLDRIDAVLDVGKAYNNFSGIADDMAGSVKFIIETSGI